MYKFRLPIGDWSDDGHGKCKYFTITSDKPVEEVREAHFKIEEKTGIDVESICSKYRDSSITVEELDELVKFGVDIEEFDLPYKGMIGVSTEGMCHIWVTLLNYVDPKLNLKVEEELPMLPFYGFDKKKRHIGFVGYGCFH